MATDRKRRAEQIFKAALDIEPTKRKAFLLRQCHHDNELRTEVERLLDADSAADGFLSSPFRPSTDEGNPQLTDDPLIGQRIGRYHVDRRIAVGGMGAVYAARQDRPKRLVALKIIRAGFESGSAVRRFNYESDILSRLRHPGIGHVYEAGTHRTGTGAYPFFAMEYFEQAKSITRHADDAKMSVQQRLELFTKVCAAVQHGHQHGIIHRDLKPANILVTTDGEPKVIDFGVAKTTDSDVTLATMRTDTGSIVGTLRYMSPEQCRGDSAEIDARSDVYALGVVLYELLVGKPPYDLKDTSPFDLPRVIRDTEPERLSTVNRALKGDIETIVFKALRKDRARRYGSVAALSEDIRRYLRNEPILARPATLLYQLSRFARRNRAVTACLVLLFFVLSVSVVGISLSLIRARRAERVAIERLHKAEYEAAKAEAFGDSLQRLLRSASPDVARGRDISLLREMLEEAERDARTGLDHLPEVKAAMQQTIGETYYDLGLYAEAERLLNSALTERREVLGHEHMDVAETLKTLGALYCDRGDYEAAIAALRQSVQIARDSVDASDPRRLGAMSLLAQALIESTEPANVAEAGRLIRLVIEWQRKTLPDRSDGIAISLSTLGDVLESEGQLDEAESVLREALDISLESHGELSTYIASPLCGLGNVLLQKGRYGESEQAFRRVLKIRRRLLGEKHSALAWPSFQLAFALMHQNEFDEAETLCRQAIAIRIDRLGENHPEVADGLQRLATVLATRGNFAAARGALNTALNRLRARFGEAHHLVIECRNKLDSLPNSQ